MNRGWGVCCLAKFGSRLPTQTSRKIMMKLRHSRSRIPPLTKSIANKSSAPRHADQTEGASPPSRRSRDGPILIGGEEARQRRQEAPSRRVRMLLFVRRVQRRRRPRMIRRRKSGGGRTRRQMVTPDGLARAIWRTS
jgi:hypothetical protein